MIRHPLLLPITLVSLLTTSTACLGDMPSHQRAATSDPLIQGFLNPPPEARMRMYWRVFGPAWTRVGIDHQLGLLKEAGVGGVMLMPFYPVAVDDPAKGIHNEKVLSPEFLETFAYAAKKAKSLGLRFSVEGGTGWPFGGPTVSLQDAAQRIRRVEMKPKPDGRGYALPALKEGERILAAWRGSERVAPGELAALQSEAHGVPARHSERSEESRFAVVGRSESGFFAPLRMTACAPLRMMAVAPDSAETGPLTLFITGPTYMKVKRPALGADGYVIDHYNTPALVRWLDANVKPLLDAAPGLVESIFCDSLEVYNSNWTHDFPAEFRKRRGYDIVERLPELFDEKAPASPDLRFDFWRTLAEMNEERFTKPLAAWSHKHGVKLEMESYGTPPSPLTSFRHIDVPTGEQYEWMGFSFSRYAASGGHLAGRRLIGAEAWTWTGIPNRLIDSLRDLKLASDYHFLAGINDLTGVDFAYSPPNVPPPGWLPYFGPVMNQNNPQWPYFKYLVQYVNRCQWLLRQGKPVAQVAIYLPVEQSFAHGPIEQMPLDFLLRDHFVTGEKTGEFGLDNARKHRSELIHTLITHGFNFDGIDFWTLIRHARVKNGKLICGDGEYSIVILPNLEGMELEAVGKLQEFVRSGGKLIVVGTVPRRTFGQHDRGTYFEPQLSTLLNEKYLGGPVTSISSRHVGRGEVAFIPCDKQFETSLMNECYGNGTTGQWSWILDSDNRGIVAVIRSVGRRQIFFVFNPTDSRIEGSFGIIRSKQQATKLDPATGSISAPVPVFAITRGLTLAEFALSPGGSVFLIGEDARGLQPRLSRIIPPQPAGEPLRTKKWKVTFSGPDAPESLESWDLKVWRDWPGGKYFSGQATYETTFDWTEPVKGSIRLRFGEVREAGEVWVNGKLAGGLWLQPYEVEIGPLLRPGKNTLKVTVGNTMLNRFLGLPDEDLGPLRAAYGNRFHDPQEKRIVKEPPPSGLIGPVEIIRE